jgi:hypothetical protein
MINEQALKDRLQRIAKEKKFPSMLAGSNFF